MCTGFRRLIRNSILLVLTITCVPDTDAGQQVLQSGEPARLAVVGKVIDATTSQPIVGATVTFTALPARQAIRPMSAVSARGSTRTDETGAFSVAANNTIGLRIAAAADGYIPGAYGQMWPKDPVQRDYPARQFRVCRVHGAQILRRSTRNEFVS